MRRVYLLLFFVMLSISSAPARSDISEDLKFCANLKAGKERLACYDAAARIEKSPRPFKEARAEIPRKTYAAETAPALPQKHQFDGVYVGATGGYQFANSSAGVDYNNNLSIPFDSTKGARVGGLVGYGVTSGNLYFGFEGRGQYSFAKSSTGRSVSSAPIYNFPYMMSSLTCFGCDQSFLNNYPLPSQTLVTGSNYSTSIERRQDYQFDFSVRPGVLIQDTMLFAKLGVGFERTVASASNNISFTTCDPSYVRARPDVNTVQIIATGCNSTTQQASFRNSAARSYNAIGIFGAGVERNFGQYFARAEGEFTAHFIDGATYYTPSANLAVGYRF